MTEIIPRDSKAKSLFVLNKFSSPKDHVQRFKLILKKACSKAGDNPLVVAENFNAPYGIWWYKYDTTKRKHLWQNAAKLDLTLATDPEILTRTGTYTCRDTTPDLFFARNATEFRWCNFLEDLQ